METEHHHALFRQVADKLPSCRHPLVIDQDALNHLQKQGATIARPGSTSAWPG